MARYPPRVRCKLPNWEDTNRVTIPEHLIMPSSIYPTAMQLIADIEENPEVGLVWPGLVGVEKSYDVLAV